MRRWRRRNRDYEIAPIPKRHITAFLERPRTDYRPWKKFDAADLERRQEQLEFEPPFWQKLHQDQKMCFLIGAQQPRFAFFNDPSTGKTLLALALARFHRWRNKVRRVLVLVPNLSNKVEWEREIKKHARSMSYTILEGSSRQKWQQIERDVLITVETYAGLTRLASGREYNPKKERDVLKPTKKLVKKLCQMFDGIVLDESSEVRSKGGRNVIIFRLLRKLTQNANMVLALSGTPLGRDPTDLWAQMYFVDKGETLGETLTLFRAAFFIVKPKHFGGFDYQFKRSERPLLHNLLANRCIRITVKEADLPKVNYVPKYIKLPEENFDWHERAMRELRRSRDGLERKNTFLRMRQISSGFVGLPADEDGRKAKLVFDENPKLELLGDLVQSIPEEYKLIIFHEFIWSGERIGEELKRRRISYVSLRGGTDNPSDVLKKFHQEGTQAIVLNHKAGGFGLNLQDAGYAFFYESPVSPIMRRQTEMRIRRKYSEWERIAIYDLLAEGTMDETIREWHEEGKDLSEAILDGCFKPRRTV